VHRTKVVLARARFAAALAVVVVAMSSARPARADVANPPDNCIAADQERAGEQCVNCRNTSIDCAEEYGQKGYSQRCVAEDDSAFEVWCKTADATDAGAAGAGSRPSPSSDRDEATGDDGGGGCAVAHGEQGGLWRLAWAALVVLSFGVRRKSR
jgi:MYXO-CTERM domain-containing protein